jgi:hypothetical protein
MTNEQENHLAEIKAHFAEAVDRKYRRGAEEHCCDIRDYSAMWLLEEAVNENIDQFTYLTTLRTKLIEVGMGDMAKRVDERQQTLPFDSGDAEKSVIAFR